MAATTTLTSTGGRLAGLRGLVRTNPGLPPGLVAIAAFVALAASEAGFYPIDSSLHPGLGWYPAALLLLGLLAAAVIAVPPRAVPRPVLAALALLAGYTAWSFLSITWAEQQGVAWDGANRTAIYLLVFALFALWPLTARGAQILLGALGLGLAGLGLVELLRADAAAEPTLFFVDARLAEPAGYINANVALWTLGLLLCLHLAITREANPALRGLGMGGAGILACLALLGQSRGWVIVMPAAALAFVALTPYRARAMAVVGAVILGTVAVSGSLLAVHDDFTDDASMEALLGTATDRILALAAVLALAGLVTAMLDRRITLSAARSRSVDRGAVVGLLAMLAAGAATAVVAVGSPVGKASDFWESFKQGGEGTQAGDSRFASVGTNRYDFWTVAWGRFRDRPLVGIGSENFQQDYLARGNSGEQPRYPHSLPIGVLSQTGIVGGLLLGGALLSAAFAAIWRRRRTAIEAAAVAAAGTVFVYWLLHASVDWFWEFPGLTAPAFAALGVAVAVGRRERPDADERRPRKGRAAIVVSAAAASALLVSLVLPWLAEREVERAASGWSASPPLAFERLERAGRLNPLTPRPHLVAGAIAVRIEDEARAAAAFEDVLALEPRTPFALAELAALASERGQGDRAAALLELASAYAPNDEVVKVALEQLRSGGRIEIRDLNSRYLEMARGRVGRD